MTWLLKEFIEEECDSDFNDFILKKLNSTGVENEWIFVNRFILEIDYKDRVIAIHDELEVDESSSVNLTFADFLKKIASQ